MNQTRRIAAVCAVVILCAGPGFAATEKAKARPKQETPKPAASPEVSTLSGKVTETMNSGGYTYVCLEKDGTKTWVAVPQMEISVGQDMAFQPGAVMHNFPSKSLNRTFDTIVFSSGPAASGSQSSQHQAHGAAESAGGGSKAAATAVDKDVKVEKAAGANAYSVGEIYEKRASLNKKTAVVRGKVVKVSKGIMDRNWIHVQDGTGDPAKGSHNLVVTSDELPKVGDVVTIKGTVVKDKDFGAGYKYAVIMEKGKLQP